MPQSTRRITGIVVGTLTDPRTRRVDYLGNEEGPLVARSIVPLSGLPRGAEVALAFEDGDAARPVVLGPIQSALAADADGESVEIEARREIVLRCGRSSITLTRAGKIVLRGQYVVSHASGVNRVRGGSVQIN